jgi:alpha-beta hydrolase superfamily lysophospholipase
MPIFICMIPTAHQTINCFRSCEFLDVRSDFTVWNDAIIKSGGLNSIEMCGSSSPDQTKFIPNSAQNIMQHQEGTFAGGGNLTLYYQSWHPSVPPHAIVTIVHGLGAHSGWFANLVRCLVENGYAVYGFDLRGHGRSAGQRGYINSWEEFRSDLRAFRQLIALAAADLPCFLLGHSLGGTIVLDYVLRDPTSFQGAIAMAPALEHVGIPPVRLGIGYILSVVCPRFALDTGIGLAVGARDPELLNAFDRDPLRHRQGTARLVTEFFKTVDWIESHISQLQIPLLILHGDADRVACPETSRRLYNLATIADKELQAYPGLYHELHHDFDYEQVLSDLVAWLGMRTK